MADDEVIIKLDAEEGDGKTGASENDAVKDLKSQFETLKAENEANKRGRDEADRRAAQAREDANRAREETRTARSEVTDSELGAVVSGIAAAQAEAEAAEAEFAAAAEEGNFAKQAKAQRRIARAEAKLQRLDEAKSDIEVRRATPDDGRRRPEGGTRAPDRSASAADPVETFISTRDSGTQAWLRAHPDEARALILDPNSRRAQKLIAADADAVAEGFTRGSTEYFQHIESFVGLTKKDQPNGQAQNGGERRRSSPPAAPVSNASGAGSGAGGMEVRLSPNEVAASEDGTIVWNPGNRHPKTGEPIKHGDPLVGQPVGRREYARRKLSQTREGLHDPGRWLVEQ